jgi:uncharacterized membrane protein YfcA
MEYEIVLIACLCFLVVSFLYSTVGHAGASGYLAIMALLSFPVQSIKPVSLILNIVVSVIATYKFLKVGRFDRKVFIAFAITSIPMAFVGGYLKIDPHLFKILAGLFLVSSAVLLLARQLIKPNTSVREVNMPLALVIGAIIGLLSGLLGVGGGIFLSPIILMLGWATIRNASGIAALFILCNSILGLAGNYVALKSVPHEIIYFIPVVILGGFIGSHYGSQKFNNKIILAFLFVVLLSAGIKFVFVG